MPREERNHSDYLGSRSKRALDLAAAVVLLLSAAPLIALIVLAILLTVGRPILFVQERAGLRGRPFRVIKFRTMRPGPPHPGSETQLHDPRITRVGHWLRRTGLDELPQLVNVLRGEMSIVGPRPLLQWEIDRCDAVQRDRLLAKPGLTGLAQVNGRNRIDWDLRIGWDLTYLHHASFTGDLAIVLRTARIVLTGADAYAAHPTHAPAPSEDAASSGPAPA